MLLGFDIGGTKCAVVLGDKPGDNICIVDKRVLPTNKPAAEMIEDLFAAAEQMLSESHFNKNSLSGIGISCGGPLDSRRGIILSPPNLPGWDNIPIVAMAEERFGVKAVLQNDANACACAEWKYGAGRRCNNVIFLTFGTGMGAGLILNGQLYSGTNDLAGEAGHIRLADDGPVGFGKAGSFEGFCSGSGIAQLAQLRAKEILQNGGRISFCNSDADLPFVTASTVADAAYSGDATAIDIYRTVGSYLGKGVSILIDILNPEVVIIGSIYARAQSLIEPYMLEEIRREALTGAQRVCRIVPAALGESIGDIAALALAETE